MSNLGDEVALDGEPSWQNPPLQSDAVILPVLQRTVFRFTARANETQRIVLARGLDISSWRSGALVVIQHAKTVAFSPTASVNIEAINSSFSPLDPNLEFLDSSGHALASSTGMTLTSPPSVEVVPFLLHLAERAHVQLVFAQGATLGGSQELVVSSFLIGRR